MADQFTTIEDYIALHEESIQLLLKQVHDAIREAIPDAEERISWRMPTFWKNHNIIHFASFKKHIGLYPGDQAIVHFESELAPYKTSKGAIQFKHGEPLPLKLIQAIAIWCYETNSHH